MSIAGRLSEFSLGEIFHLLERGQKTGLLTIRATHAPAEALQNFYLWFNQGQIVAAANRLDYKGLATLIYQREWLGDHSKTLLQAAFKSQRPLGLYLKCQGSLSAEQLKLLFYTQVLRQVCTFFTLAEGWFNFEMTSALPLAEMTGLSAVPTDVTLEGLRALKDWGALASKLPDSSSAITALSKGQPQLKIKPTEWQVWEFANGTVPLTAIAEQMQLPLAKIQQIAFRLIIVGLIEEIPFVVSTPSRAPEVALPEPELATPGAQVSHAFLSSLMGFLATKAA